MIQERYARQVSMPEIGPHGQEKLASARVLVVGAGGLGSPVLLYLAAAGVGQLGIVDADSVSHSNLNRQILYGESDLGAHKVTAAVARLRALNGQIELTAHDQVLNAHTAAELVRPYHVIVDCVDNWGTRHLVNRAALACDIPLVEAGIEGFYGFALSVARGQACAACMQPALGKLQANGQGGIPVLGATAGLVGSLQATECVKILLGVGRPLYSRLLLLDSLRMEFDELELRPDPVCAVCAAFQA